MSAAIVAALKCPPPVFRVADFFLVVEKNVGEVFELAPHCEKLFIVAAVVVVAVVNVLISLV